MCWVIALLGLADVFLPDPIPYIDEVVLILGPLFLCKDIRPKLIAMIAAVGEVLLRLP